MTIPPDEFEGLLRQSDPASDAVEPGDEDLILLQSQQQWSSLVQRRVLLRRRLTYSLAASGLLALVAGAMLWARHSGQPHVIADSTEIGQDELLSPARNQPPDVPIANQNQRAIASEPPKPSDPSDATTIQKSQSLTAFSEFVEAAGKIGSDPWRDQCQQLADHDAQTQRLAIELVGQMEDAPLRSRAFELVLQSAGADQRQVLSHWLSVPALRSKAWSRLTDRASLSELTQLIEQTRNDAERFVLCDRIAQASDPKSLDVLLGLVQRPDWRPIVRFSTVRLPDAKIRRLIMLMRERNVSVRTAAAFILASVQDDKVDQTVATMILRRRFQQPAYLVLLSRNTPRARAFLAQAASNPQLTPALFSAQAHFATIQRQLQQWIAESKGTYDEKSDTTRRPSSNRFDSHRIALRDHLAIELG